MGEIRIMESSPLVIEVEDDDGNTVARTAALGVSGIDSDWSIEVCDDRSGGAVTEHRFGMKEVPGVDGDPEYRIEISF